ncbi:flagellar hook-associated protein FlgK [Roseovarius spongiae]|uniref:Flagellar hook-associated protein 1 n=1 Tax=Roseovarius spongiae TaxID=2320272 RepID=A0A3A8B246_9RHOB|nr:flagellar hook-associated protein FlgK [Roseovarius spongiae]RKF13026.1 flagellar hook-associated protein FlgK [Roseovarius spongiae]
MSISSALSNALSGLTANARAVNVVSSNLANLDTEGYARRDIELAANSHGASGGVQVVGVTRHVDAGLLGDRRMADGSLAHAQTRAGFIESVQNAIGTPDEPGSLSARLAALEVSLVTAAARPDAQDRLEAAAQRAGELTGALRSASNHIQSSRQDAEAGIESAVQMLNTSFEQVQDLNRRISDARGRGLGSSGLEDQRQVVIDRIAEFIPVREVPRNRGTVALMTPGGALLVDSTAATLEFTRANVIAPHLTLDGGLLSGLVIDGQTVPPSGPRSPVAGGKLAALFELRDDLAPDAQAQIDAIARDVIERFQSPSVDATLGAGDPGLFTDGGAAFAPVNETGIAGRVTLNALVDPAQGGDAWRLRDGLNAAAPGPAGNSRQLHALSDALSARGALASGGLGGGAGDASHHVAKLTSHFGQLQVTEDRARSHSAALASETQERLLETGVDSDAETQRLLLIEQAYAANARMIRTLDEMMQTLLRI